MRGIYKTREIAQGLDTAVEDFKTKKIRSDLERIRINIENMKINIAIEEDNYNGLIIKEDNIKFELYHLKQFQKINCFMKIQDIQIFNRLRLYFIRKSYKKDADKATKIRKESLEYIEELKESLEKPKKEYQTKINIPFDKLFYYIFCNKDPNTEYDAIPRYFTHKKEKK